MRFRKKHSLFPRIRPVAPDSSESANQKSAVERLELVEPASVPRCVDDFPNVVRFFDRSARCRKSFWDRSGISVRKPEAAGVWQRVSIGIFLEQYAWRPHHFAPVVGNAGNPAVNVGAARSSPSPLHRWQLCTRGGPPRKMVPGCGRSPLHHSWREHRLRLRCRNRALRDLIDACSRHGGLIVKCGQNARGRETLPPAEVEKRLPESTR